MKEELRYVIVLTTSKGEFYWNSYSVHDYEQRLGVNRTFGWVNAVGAAQHYQKAHAARRQATGLETDLGRLFDCVLAVRPVTLRYDKNTTPVLTYHLHEVQP
jgi:hypothetical protein